MHSDNTSVWLSYKPTNSGTRERENLVRERKNMDSIEWRKRNENQREREKMSKTITDQRYPKGN